MAQATEVPFMSITKRLKQMGMQSPDDLISSILDDTEQSRHNHHPGIPLVVGQTPHGSSGRPSGTRRTVSAPSEVYSNTESEAEMMSVVNHRLMRARAGSEAAPSPLTLKQTHWKPLAYASKCAGPICRKRFAMLDRRRNCSMCGEVFCRHCTNYRRKLSANAIPDSFGTFQHVCRRCFNQYSLVGGSRDLMSEFGPIRRGTRNSKVVDDSSLPLCARKSSDKKREVIETELERLTNGFQENAGFLRGLMSDFKVPIWQRASLWVDSKDTNECFHCKKAFGKVARKLHCRVGGHIFCKSCTKDEILLYLSDDGKARWAVNGKDGGPTSTPSRYEMFPICPNCSNELQIMMIERLTVPTPMTDDFLDDLHTLHKGLSKVQDKIEESLPEYQTLVDALDMVDNSPQSVKGRNPMQKLIKSQSDLSDAFSALAVGSQRLKLLKPKTVSQERLLRHAMIGTYQFYSENMYHFRCTRQRLSELMPIDHLEEIQLALSQQSMERIHVLIHQLMYEALNLEKRYEFESSFFQHIVTVMENIENEFKPFLEKRDEDWDMHMEIVMKFVQEQMRGNRNLIKVQRSVSSQPISVRYIVISQCASRLHECLRELQAKTIDREFKKTKESLYTSCSQLDRTLVGANAPST